MSSGRQGHRLRLENVTQRFQDFTAVDTINLDVAGGEMVALLGPSGCGKSTLLRIISGFIRQTEGHVRFDEQIVDHQTPSQRGIGIVFQNYALFPHMTVADNVAYGLEARKWPRAKIAARVEEMLALVHMLEFRDRKPRQLSGGQQQRIALARCLAIEPKVLLLDEPFGALDKNLRLDMQIEVKRLVRASGVTTILVTHDQEEALSMADRIAVMSRGHIEQVSTPTEIYDQPQTLFVNQFVGTTNVIPGEFVPAGEAARVMLQDGLSLDVPKKPGFIAGSKVVVSIRPEQLQIVQAGGLPGTVKAVMPLGAHVVYDIEPAPGLSMKVSEPREKSAALRARRCRQHRAGLQASLSPVSRAMTTSRAMMAPRIFTQGEPMLHRPTRRKILTGTAALASSLAMPGIVRAQSGSLVAATFPGTWNEVDAKVIGPMFKSATGAALTQSVVLGTDQVARLTAAKGNKPPFDVAFFDAPQVLDAAKEGLIVEYPAAKSPNFSSLIPKFQGKWGPTITMQVIGIGYNPKKITTPPKSWDELWDPKYKGRVGLTALNSQLGIAFLAELNRIKGGTESGFEPAFKALRELLPNVGAIAANLGAYATLWQQEQIDIAPYNFNFVQTLKAKDVPVEFAVPQTGAAGWETSLHVVANSENTDLAVKYIDMHLDPAVQAQVMKPPYDVIPTSSKVKLEGAITNSIAKTQDDLAKVRGFDWAKLNPQRGALIERFNREIKL
jgi:ABC-type Fe3+/spermidine/putrescine transport system ATPase subunit/spermidine/putrescine-binding protein